MKKNQRSYYLQQIGIDVWEERKPQKRSLKYTRNFSKSVLSPSEEAGQASAESDSEPHFEQTSVSDTKEYAWQALIEKAQNCQSCALSKTRTHVVFGVGNQEADLMIIGEAPGFYEDQQAEPFVGKAGQLLNQMIASMNKKRSDVYIANLLKCRPPENRDPQLEEVAQCKPFLTQQIDLVSPKVILALGRHAARFLLNTDTSIGELRGKWHHWGKLNIPVRVSYHPAYLLRNPFDKSKAFADLLCVKKELQRHSPFSLVR